MVRTQSKKEMAESSSSVRPKCSWSRLVFVVVVFFPLVVSFALAEEIPDFLAKWQSQQGEGSLISHMLRQRQRGRATEAAGRNLVVNFNYILMGKSISSCPNLDITNPNVTGIPLPNNITCLANTTDMPHLIEPPSVDFNVTSIIVDCMYAGQLLLYNGSGECGNGTYIPTTRLCFPAYLNNNTTWYISLGCIAPK